MILMIQHKEEEEEEEEEEQVDVGHHNDIVHYLTSGSPPSVRIIMRKQCCSAQMMSCSNLGVTRPVCHGTYRNVLLANSFTLNHQISLILPLLGEKHARKPNNNKYLMLLYCVLGCHQLYIGLCSVAFIVMIM
jgi:hypothetical protein